MTGGGTSAARAYDGVVRSAPARSVVALMALAAAPAPGCGIIEANVRAVEVLASDHATDGEQAYAVAVVGGTLAAITGLAVAATIAGAQASSREPEPAKIVIERELAWGFRYEGDDARWFRCTSPLLCTHEEVVEHRRAVLEVVPAGRGRPVALGGAVGDEVDLVAIRVRRER